MNVALYVRVSTDMQTYENQLLQLTQFCKSKEYLVVETYKETISGKEGNRPEFKRMLDDAYKRKFEAIVVWSLDRFTREGVGKLWHYLNLLDSYKVKFISYNEPYINSDNDFREVMISFLGKMAEIERIRMVERTKAGLDRARKQGKQLGRRSKLTIAQIQAIREKYALGTSKSRISKDMSINIGSVSYVLKKPVINAKYKQFTR